MTLERRSFLKWATNALGAVFAAALGVPAVAYLIDARNRKAPDSDFRTVAKLDDLPVGEPQQVTIRDVRRDAWTLHPSDLIGRVWLIRRDQNNVDAYTTTCPHLGCSVNFEKGEKLFICPCHNGTFDINGQIKEVPGRPNPAPRGMDQLECRRDPDDPELIQVKYQNFYQGRHEKVPVS